MTQAIWKYTITLSLLFTFMWSNMLLESTLLGKSILRISIKIWNM